MCIWGREGGIGDEILKYGVSGIVDWVLVVKVRINREECIGCGVCEALCGEVFKLLEDGKSGIVEAYRKSDDSQGDVDEKLRDCVENAKESCPVSVISTE